MPAFAPTLRQDIQGAGPDHQSENSAESLGSSESALRAAISSAGHSVAEAGRHVGQRISARRARSRPGPSTAFSDEPNARRLCELLTRLDEAVYVDAGLREEIDFLTEEISKAICDGTITLEYAPGKTEYVTIPAVDEPCRVQALLYWRIRLETTIPKLLEARGRLGDGASIEETKRMFKRIDQDARAAQTDYSDVPPAAST